MRTDVSAELLSQSPHQDQRLVHCWAYSVQFQRLSARPGRNYISFDGRFQVEYPAAYKPSPSMETGNCHNLGLRLKHLFFPVATLIGRFTSALVASLLPNVDAYAIGSSSQWLKA